MEWVTTTGRTVAEAKERALDQLGVAEDDAEFEVLDEPRPGLFGRLRGEARVRARVRPTQPRPKMDRRDRRRSRRDGEAEGSGAETPDGTPRPATPTSGSSASTGGRSGAARSSRTTRGRGRGGAAERTTAGDAEQLTSNNAGETGAVTPRAPSRRVAAAALAPGSDGVESVETAIEGLEGVDDGDDAGETADGAVRPAGAKRRRRGGRGRGGRGPRPDGGATADDDVDHQYSQDDEIDSTRRQAGPTQQQEEPVDAQQVGDEARVFVQGLVDAFGLEGTAAVQVDGGDLEVTVDGGDLGLLVGPRGTTLQAVQELARVAAQRRHGDHDTRLRVDVGGYRVRRREALTRFALDQAAQVVAEGTARVLEPMSSSDRKVIHDALSEFEGVATRSEGDDPSRRVVIAPAHD